MTTRGSKLPRPDRASENERNLDERVTTLELAPPAPRTAYTFTNGEATPLALGEVVYVKATATATVLRAAANDAGFVAKKVPRVFVVTSGAPPGGTVQCVDEGAVEGLSGLVPGAVYYVSGTPGQITTTPPTTGIVYKLGEASSEATLVVGPEYLGRL